MEIISLGEEYEDTYCRCLEDWSEEIREAGDYKKKWLEKKKAEGLRVKLAKNDKGEIVGMIQYIPIERAPVRGAGLYYVYCIWVHGYKQGVGDYQKRGIGSALLEAAEQDSRELGAKGMAAWGVTLPFFMRSSWFKKHGYRRADREGMLELVWKPFAEDAAPPLLLKMIKKPPTEKGVVSVTCFRNGWCPGQNLACERMRRAADEYPGRVKYAEIDTDLRENGDEWGLADAIFVDDKQIVTGPPPSYEALQKLLRKRIKRLHIPL
jgi:GNAT superfamily N-acetyltransferase